jgi:UDP-N-acetylglucosamine 2-epimerase (non-hydrolysing)
LKGKEKHYAVMTLHRPANVDNVETLSKILEAVEVIQREIPLIFPVHPRTFKQIESLGLRQQVTQMRQLIVLEPLGYLEFLAVMSQAQMVLTDSGGLQEETTVLGIPCLTLRENTERPVTIWEGTNTLVGTDPRKIVEVAWEVLGNQGKTGRVPEFWDGKAADRIVEILTKRLLT